MKTVLLSLIKVYRLMVAPFVPTTCRFHPTCSQYMMESIKTKGLLRGLASGLIRLLKCHPLHPGGYDTVR